MSMQERRRIEDWWLAKVPVTEMARVLNRHKSTTFREIKRNFWADDFLFKKYTGYFGMAAYQCTQRRRSAQRKLIRYPELCQRIVSHLKDGCGQGIWRYPKHNPFTVLTAVLAAYRSNLYRAIPDVQAS
ncbi:MAG: helix-turn-helix domain-containing protein [Aliishimia sp.]